MTAAGDGFDRLIDLVAGEASAFPTPVAVVAGEAWLAYAPWDVALSSAGRVMTLSSGELKQPFSARPGSPATHYTVRGAGRGHAVTATVIARRIAGFGPRPRPKPWTADEDLIVRQNQPAEARRLIPARSLLAIRTRRKVLAANPIRRDQDTGPAIEAGSIPLAEFLDMARRACPRWLEPWDRDDVVQEAVCRRLESPAADARSLIRAAVRDQSRLVGRDELRLEAPADLSRPSWTVGEWLDATTALTLWMKNNLERTR